MWIPRQNGWLNPNRVFEITPQDGNYHVLHAKESYIQ